MLVFNQVSKKVEFVKENIQCDVKSIGKKNYTSQSTSFVTGLFLKDLSNRNIQRICSKAKGLV